MVVKINKTKSTKKCVKRKLWFENYKNRLKATQLDNKTSKFESTLDDVRAEKIISAPSWVTK